MEGKEILFFVRFKDNEAVIQLSEYETVEALKIQIDLAFNVAVSSQEICGWAKVPESDNSILKTCTDSTDVICLFVTEMKELGNLNDSILNNNPVSQINNLELELEAVSKLKSKLMPTGHLLKLNMTCFRDAATYVMDQKKIMLLFLYNSEDNFSNHFLNSLKNDEVRTLIDDMFYTIGWDVEDSFINKSLISALEPFNLSIISHLIDNRISATICLIPENNLLNLFSCMRGTNESVLEHIKMAAEHFGTIFSNYKEIVNNQNSGYEIEAIKSLKRKLPSDISVSLRHFMLDDAINFVCNSPFHERKTLLLYLHNSDLPFSKMFTNNLKNSELAQILNKHFLILGWDVENPEYHDALISALDKHVNLSIVSDLVTNKVSLALCLMPIHGIVNIAMCLRGKISLKDTLKSLKEAANTFSEEIQKEQELQKIQNEKGKEEDLGSEKLQRIWADMLGDRDYDCFEFDQHDFLKDKIGFAVSGPPQKETGYDDKIKKVINQLYGVIKTESDAIAEFKDHIEISFIYCCLEPLPETKIKRSKQYSDYNPITDVRPVPIFVLRKCRGSANPCRIFIDDTGRVYENWKEYLTRNKNPKCELVVPLNGRYEVKDDVVLLERHLSPACQIEAKVLQVGDIASTVVGLSSGGVFVVAALGVASLPVAAPVLIGAGVAGAVAGAWGIGRSSYALYDRKRHKESMSFFNSEARGAYINIVAGSLGFVGASANMALSQLVAKGVNIGQGARFAVDALGVINLTASGVGIANSGYEILDQLINEKQAPSALAIVQLSSSILFFGHAVYNFKPAQTIIEESQARVLQDYQESLRSNRHRKTFNKFMKETIRTNGDGAAGRAEVIKTIRNLSNKDEVFAALTRNNKAMNKAGVRFSAKDGKITMGGIPVDMDKFSGFTKKQTESFLSKLSQDSGGSSLFNTSNSNSTRVTDALKSSITSTLNDLKADISGANYAKYITFAFNLLKLFSSDVQTIVLKTVPILIRWISDKFTPQVAEAIDMVIPKIGQFPEFLQLVISFFSHKVDEWEERYQKYLRTHDKDYHHPLFDYINPVYAKRTVILFEFVVRNSYSGYTLTRAAMNELSSFATAWVARKVLEASEKKENDKRRDIHSAGLRPKKVDCKVCGGYYFQH